MEMVKNEVWGIILASGLSKRMGVPKLLLPLKGATIIGHVLSQALQTKLNGIIVVANGRNQELVKEIDKHSAHHIVKVEDAHLGLGNSIRKGLRRLPESADAVMFLLGDQPEITKEEMNKVIGYYQSTQQSLVVQATYFNKKGHPVLFDRRMFPFLEGIEGDMGAREILKNHKEKIHFTEMGKPPIPDIDTMEDYQKLLNRVGGTK